MPRNKTFNGVPINDIVSDLPRRNPAQSGERIERIVVYHEGTTEKGSNAFGVNNAHVYVNRWPHIGHHFVIERNGTIAQTLNLEDAGIHAGVPAFRDISILVIGNLDLAPATDDQLHALVALVKAISKGMTNEPDIIGATDFKHLDIDWVRARVAGVAANPMAMDPDKYAPGPADDPELRSFPTFYDAAVGMKGRARAAEETLRSVADYLDVAIPRLEAARRAIKEQIGR